MLNLSQQLLACHVQSRLANLPLTLWLKGLQGFSPFPVQHDLQSAVAVSLVFDLLAAPSRKVVPYATYVL